LIETAYQEIQKLKDQGVDEKDLEKVKETQKQTRIKSLEQNRFWQSQMQSSFLNGTDLNNIKLESLEGWIEKLTAADLQNAVAKYFNDDEKIQVIMHPEKTEE
jgi:zinc protease